jgi:hypothetical protein
MDFHQNYAKGSCLQMKGNFSALAALEFFRFLKLILDASRFLIDMPI